ncbi:MAG: (2Fe-2S)-binding protein [Bacteroidetes bacterium]|nr:MAG: (2Fe-2S)-binding protein [Bacteroidota bacterium]
MTRKEFLGKLGLGAAFVLTSACLGGCTKEPITAVDFTLDLNDPANAALQTPGGYVVVDRVVVARTMDGDYVAATRICSHEGKWQVILKDDEWYCTAHGARFDLQGNGLNSKGSKGIAVYQTELNGNLLHVFG